MMKQGFTVALIGPDGAGKTTVARRLEQVLPIPVKYVYMGVNPDSSNYLLPTTRVVHAVRRLRGAKPDTAGPRDSRAPDRAPPKGIPKRALRTGRSFLSLGNRLAEEWHRALVASLHRRRGSIVVFDRHFFADYLRLRRLRQAAPLGQQAHPRVCSLAPLSAAGPRHLPRCSGRDAPEAQG